MSSKTVTRWTCDRCGRTTELEWRGGVSQPNDWISVWRSSPPNANPLESKVPKMNLCVQCRNALSDWLTKSAVEEQA